MGTSSHAIHFVVIGVDGSHLGELPLGMGMRLFDFLRVAALTKNSPAIPGRVAHGCKRVENVCRRDADYDGMCVDIEVVCESGKHARSSGRPSQEPELGAIVESGNHDGPGWLGAPASAGQWNQIKTR